MEMHKKNSCGIFGSKTSEVPALRPVANYPIIITIIFIKNYCFRPDKIIV